MKHLDISKSNEQNFVALKLDRSSCLLYYLAITQAVKRWNRFFIKVGGFFKYNVALGSSADL